MMRDDTAQSSKYTNGDLTIDYAAGCAFLGPDELHPTPMEYRLLCLLARNVGRVLTHTCITEHVWWRGCSGDVGSLRVFMDGLPP